MRNRPLHLFGTALLMVSLASCALDQTPSGTLQPVDVDASEHEDLHLGFSDLGSCAEEFAPLNLVEDSNSHRLEYDLKDGAVLYAASYVLDDEASVRLLERARQAPTSCSDPSAAVVEAPDLALASAQRARVPASAVVALSERPVPSNASASSLVAEVERVVLRVEHRVVVLTLARSSLAGPVGVAASADPLYLATLAAKAADRVREDRVSSQAL